MSPHPIETVSTERAGKTALLLETGDPVLEAILPPGKLRSLVKARADVEVHEARSWSGPDAADRIAFLCAEKGFTSAVVCGPSSEAAFLPEYVTPPGSVVGVPIAFAAVRDHCARVEPDRTVAAFKAERLVLMAVARVRGTTPIALSQVAAERTVVVVGSNHAAYETAAALVENGFPTILVETEPPAGCFYPISETLVREVRRERKVRILSRASIRQVSGCVGGYRLELSTPAGRKTVTAGAIVVAIDAETGALELDCALAGNPRVKTLREYGELVGKGGVDGESVCIWLDRNGPDRRCAGHAAVQYSLDHIKKGGRPVVLFRHAPVYGHLGQLLYDDARAAGVDFIRTDGVAPRFAATDRGLTVTVKDAVLSRRPVEFDVDHLVVPEPTVPSAQNLQLARLLRQPLDLEGYLQSGNVRHRPVGSARKGVYFVGGCHDECDPEEARLEAQAVVADLMAVLPEGHVDVPVGKVVLDKGRCAGCLNCMRKCPHGAIQPRESGRWMEYMDPACFQCGICASVCPGLALEHSSLRFSQIRDTLGVATQPLRGRAPIVAFACRQSAIPAADMAGRQGLPLPPDVLLIDVPCAGLVSDNMILEALVQAARGVLVLGCHHDNCRSLWGSDLNRKRVEKVRKRLEDIGCEGARVRFHSLASNEPHRLAHLLTRAAKELPKGCINGQSQTEEKHVGHDRCKVA